MPDSPFAGFPKGTLAFLDGLAAHNAKPWFDAHRAEYETFYVEPAKAFVNALGPKLRKLQPGLHFEPRVNGSLFRINRDIRFAKDKSPYKTHLDLWFWLGDAKGWDCPGFFFRLTPERVIVGGGMHMLSKPALDAYRHAVVDPKAGAALVAALAKVRKAGADVGGSSRKTVPRGFDKMHPHAALLLHEGLTAGLEVPVPKEAATAKFVDWCVKRYAAAVPLNDWLLRYVVKK
jgi:uncharacterized protein (TIGR02453 family)